MFPLSSSIKKKVFCLSTWNANGIKTAQPYIKHLMSFSDIIAISEHHLHSYELCKLDKLCPGLRSFGTSYENPDNSHMGNRGVGGVALLWKETLDPYIKARHDMSKDRMCTIELNTSDDVKLFIISVYLPHSSCKIAKFDTILSNIEEIIVKALLEGEVIVAGDFNAHLGARYGKRCTGVSTRNGNLLGAMASRLDMSITDLSPKGEGPTYTFQSECGWESYIDHCLVTEQLEPLVTNCQVNEDVVINTSDHLSVSLYLDVVHLPIKPPNTSIGTERLAWHKVNENQIRNSYTPMVSEKLYGLKADLLRGNVCLEGEQLDYVLTEIAKTLIESSKATIPKSKFRKYLKPYWNCQLKLLSKHKINVWRKWKASGKPRDENSQIWRDYKDSKRDFRRSQRIAEAEYERGVIEELSNAEVIDQKQFWSLIRKRKGTNVRADAIRNEAGELLRDPNDINYRWAQYFKHMHNDVPSGIFNDEFKEEITATVVRIKSGYNDMLNNHDNMVRFSVNDIRDECHKLKTKKAAGWDKVQAEHLKYGGNVLYEILTKVYNTILVTASVPSYFKKGLIVPIPKGNGKDFTSVDNYRGISLLPALSKVFERLLLRKLDDIATDRIDEMQGASHASCSSLHTSFLVQEAVACATEGKSTPYVALLDTRKAFDTVWHDGLFYQLHQLGCPRTLWMILVSFYTDFKCAVLTGGITSKWFSVSQGVHQGAPCSMKLYQVFCNELLASIKSCRKGLSVHGINVSCPTFADDIVLISIHEHCLQNMLNIAYNYSIKWRFQFNAQKSCVMCLSKRTQPLLLKLGNQIIPYQTGYIHVGVPLTASSEWLATELHKRVARGRRCILAAMSLGNYDVPMAPNVCAKVYWSMAIPQIAYGLHLTSLSAMHWDVLEVSHKNIAKRVQGLSKSAPNPVPLATLGWLSISAHIAVARISFILAISLLPLDNVYRRLAFIRINNHSMRPKQIGPVAESLHAAAKYGMLNNVTEAFNGNDVRTIKSWKGHVKKKVVEIETQRWLMSCILYSRLRIFSSAIKQFMWPWWKHAALYVEDTKSCTKMLRLMIEFTDNHHAICKFCNEYCVISAEHFIFECKFGSELRNVLWDEVLRNSPGVMGLMLREMSYAERVIFILSGFKCTYVKEWGKFYSICCKFIAQIYDTFQDPV